MAASQGQACSAARAGAKASHWHTHKPGQNTRGSHACSGFVQVVFSDPELFFISEWWDSRRRGFARAGERGRLFPRDYVSHARRKVDVYDLCLMIDSVTDQE